MFQDIKKVCLYCKKEFVITAEDQRIAMEKGGEITRDYCWECLKRWRRGEIDLEKDNSKRG